jgi:hypothetical protein
MKFGKTDNHYIFLVICTESQKRWKALEQKKNWKVLIHDKEREKKMGDINRNGRKQKTNSFL